MCPGFLIIFLYRPVNSKKSSNASKGLAAENADSTRVHHIQTLNTPKYNVFTTTVHEALRISHVYRAEVRYASLYSVYNSVKLCTAQMSSKISVFTSWRRANRK